jgi:hypothetical protein
MMIKSSTQFNTGHEFLLGSVAGNIFICIHLLAVEARLWYICHQIVQKV